MNALTEIAPDIVGKDGSAQSPIDLARAYVHTSVQAPALASSLPTPIKAKVHHSDHWLARFKRVGDLLIYLKRFNVKHDDPVYREMKRCGLLTFEDIVDDFEKKFGQWAEDCSRISDFVIGEEYNVFDILILARSYDTRSGGMFVLEAAGKPVAVVIKATLSDGRYPNEWVQEYDILKYYLKSIGGKFGEHFKPNRAIIENHQLPIVTFVRTSDNEPFVFRGIFKYEQIVHEKDGSKAFILSRFTPNNLNVIADSQHLTTDVERAVARSMLLTREQRLDRLARASKKPATVKVVSNAYVRNPDVIAEVLTRAVGTCEGCGQPAPFLRRSDQTPYLEVHHRVPLAGGGDDSVENALALCPNCHREYHYGQVKKGVLELTSSLIEGQLLPNDPMTQTNELIE